MRVAVALNRVAVLAAILLISQIAGASNFSTNHRKILNQISKGSLYKGKKLVSRSSEAGFLGGFVRNADTSTKPKLKPPQMVISSRQLYENSILDNKGSLDPLKKRNSSKRQSVALQQTSRQTSRCRSDSESSNNMRNYRRKLNKVETGSMLPSTMRSDEIGYIKGRSLLFGVKDWIRGIDVQDAAVFTGYGCTQFALTVPVILIPLISAEPYEPGIILTENSAAFAGAIASVSFIGGGMGKLINGFVCQSLGGRTSGVIYLLGLAFFSTLLSTTYTIHGYALAGMEFCASMMWTAMSVLVAERYASNPKKFTAAITSLSLASTTGTLSAKLLGGALLSQFQWRQVCLLSTLVATLGSAVLFFFRDENYADSRVNSGVVEVPKRQEPSIQSIKSSISNVLGNKMFYVVSFSHFTAFIARSCDKILGTFIVDMTDLPRYICGTLTTSVTLGFILGLISGKKMVEMKTLREKETFVFKRYGNAVLSACALALCANQSFGALLGQYGLAAVITLVSFTFAASVAFQFYQLPTNFAASFRKDNAVFISLCDGFSLFLLSPFWSSLSNIAISSEHGWITVWLTVAGFVAVGGSIMTKSLQTVLRL